MGISLDTLKTELEQFARDQQNFADRSRRMLNITRDTGEFLAIMVRATAAGRILEIGSSNGYSTLWLAEAAQANAGRVTTLEYSDYKVALARENFARSGLDTVIDLLHVEAGQWLAACADDAFDLVFLDSDRSRYRDWWPALRRVLRPGGLLIADNAISHAEEMAEWIDEVKADPQFVGSVASIGKGQLLAVRSAVRG